MNRRQVAVLLGGALAVSAGSVAHATALDDAVAQFRPTLVNDVDAALTGAKVLRERVAANDLDGARKAWIAARGGWERAEIFTADFVPDLDDAIDAWPDGKTGFHAIEVKLFAAGSTDVLAETDTLIKNLTEVDAKARDMKLTPDGLYDGVARLAYEVGDSKVDGGESRFSGTSLNDMRYNVEGIETAYGTIFAASLEAHDAKRAADVKQYIAKLRTLVDVPDIKKADGDALRATSEAFVVTLQEAAPAIGVRKPTMEDKAN
jgi:iron uptake system EfeUOB component EfeO/EfeM